MVIYGIRTVLYLGGCPLVLHAERWAWPWPHREVRERMVADGANGAQGRPWRGQDALKQSLFRGKTVGKTFDVISHI